MLSSFDIEQSLYKLFRKLARGEEKKQKKRKRKEKSIQLRIFLSGNK